MALVVPCTLGTTLAYRPVAMCLSRMVDSLVEKDSAWAMCAHNKDIMYCFEAQVRPEQAKRWLRRNGYESGPDGQWWLAGHMPNDTGAGGHVGSGRSTTPAKPPVFADEPRCALADEAALAFGGSGRGQLGITPAAVVG